jgi:hypothetical protein
MVKKPCMRLIVQNIIKFPAYTKSRSLSLNLT